MGIGVALALQVRADRRGAGGEEGPVVGACGGPGPDSDTSVASHTSHTSHTSVTSHTSHTSVTSHTSGTSVTLASGPLTRDVLAERFLAGVRKIGGPKDFSPSEKLPSWYSASLDARVCEAARWLQAAYHGGHTFAHLHLAHLSYDAGEHNTALLYLKKHLSWHVERGALIIRRCPRKKPLWAEIASRDGTRISALYSESGARLSKTVCRLTLARRTC
jgi:hypothetical protein